LVGGASKRDSTKLIHENDIIIKLPYMTVKLLDGRHYRKCSRLFEFTAGPNKRQIFVLPHLEFIARWPTQSDLEAVVKTFFDIPSKQNLDTLFSLPRFTEGEKPSTSKSLTTVSDENFENDKEPFDMQALKDKLEALRFQRRLRGETKRWEGREELMSRLEGDF
jgi:hypothetical protein